MPNEVADVDEAAPPARPGMADEALPDTLLPGDTLAVAYVAAVGLEPVTTSLDRSGTLHLPQLGDFRIIGMTLTEAEALVQVKLSSEDRFARVSLSLQQTKARQVTVTGAVEKPGNVALEGDMRLAQVLASVGGIRQANSNDRVVTLGDLDGTRLMREGVALPIDARKALEGDLRHNVRVRSGDVVVVPPALHGRIIVLGDVRKPQTFPFRQGMRLTEVLADAGGLTREADAADVRVLRGGFAHPRIYRANVNDLLLAKRSDVVLAAGDVVFVTEHWLASVGDVLARVVPAAATGALVAGVVAP
jgi:polysaccharide export outer membrane protein